MNYNYKFPFIIIFLLEKQDARPKKKISERLCENIRMSPNVVGKLCEEIKVIAFFRKCKV
jgi:hypothetical protein